MIDLIIAMGTLNPVPIPSEPCRIISTPHGGMCTPKVARSLKVYGIIRTERETDAKRICHGMAGAGYQIWKTDVGEWLCVKK